MKKKAVLGNITTIFPVFVLVVIIMAAYIVISYSLALSNPAQTENFESQISEQILTKPIKFVATDGKTEETLLLDLIALRIKNKISQEEFSQKIQSSLEDGNCEIIYINSEIYSFKKERGIIIPYLIPESQGFEQQIENHEEFVEKLKNSAVKINIDGNLNEIKTYRGECL